MNNFFTIFVLLPLFCFGQKQGNIWYFGDHAGLNFNSGSPIPLTNGQTYSPDGNSIEGSAVISDSSGSLLFYTNGNKIWNRNQQVMPNGDSIYSDFSSTQGALIVAQPGSSRYFYVFTVDDFLKHNLQYGFRYSMVDICRNNGLGDVIPNQKNIKLLDTVCEKLTAVRHANGIDYWIIVHKYYSDAFYTYHLSSVGIIDTVISHIGSRHPVPYGPQNSGYSIGYLRASPNGQKLCVVSGNGFGIAEYFDFDKSTGIVSNPVNIQTDSVYCYYGASFSPDNSKLYIACWLNNNGVYQFNLNAGGGNPDSVIASKIIIAGQSPSHWAMQLGPDGKIYIATGTAYLSVISNPNNIGLNCNYADNVIHLFGNINNQDMGLPNFIDSYDYSNTTFQCLEVNVSSTSVCTGACTGTATAIPTNGTSPYTYSWNTSPLQTTQIASGLCAGNYQVIVNDASGSVDTLSVVVSSSPIASITGLTTICKGQNTLLIASGGGTYLWNTNATTNTIIVNPINDTVYSVIASNSGCSDTALMAINVNISPNASINGNSIICNGQSTILSATGGGTYSWNTGATMAAITVAPMTTNLYSVIVTNGSGCSDTTSQIVIVNSSPTAVISGNTKICNGQSTILTAGGGTIFNWNTGANTSTISVAPIVATTYSITVTNASGCTDTASQTITVTAYPTASISGNSTICKGNNTTLIATGGSTYLWNTGETNPSITISPLTNTADSVIVSNGLCSDTAFINIIVNNKPTANAGANITIVAGDSTLLNVTGGGTYSWSPTTGLSCINCANPIASPSVTTDYCVTITDNNGCTDSACVNISIENHCSTNDNFSVPNAFSPNNDGHNDLFVLQGWKSCVKEFTFVIYDRWGEKVFESEDADKGWDGSYKGKLMNTAVFVYYVYATSISGEKIIRKGNISLIR